ncbi:hypothetical protein PR048_021866 [Dryococelus australis]|uniref:Uncharacterized protein n=1 Tax=Dryococelus australis TaxID=614101 RepID=A0ABQ9GZD7_9NEOP|nr:hypothetical protein PR048_021866 [Dryococelus australis]
MELARRWDRGQRRDANVTKRQAPRENPLAKGKVSRIRTSVSVPAGNRTPLVAVRLPCSPPTMAGPGSIPGRVTPGLSHVGIVPDDAAGPRFFSGISRFSCPCIPALLHSHLNNPHRLFRLRTPLHTGDSANEHKAVSPYLAVMGFAMCFLATCKETHCESHIAAIGSETCRAGLIYSDPIAKTVARPKQRVGTRNLGRGPTVRSNRLVVPGSPRGYFRTPSAAVGRGGRLLPHSGPATIDLPPTSVVSNTPLVLRPCRAPPPPPLRSARSRVLRLGFAIHGLLCILEHQLSVHWLLPHTWQLWNSQGVSLQVCYWPRGVQVVSNKRRSNCRGRIPIHRRECSLAHSWRRVRSPLLLSQLERDRERESERERERERESEKESERRRTLAAHSYALFFSSHQTRKETITASCGATANEHSAEAPVCKRIDESSLQVIELAKISYPYEEGRESCKEACIAADRDWADMANNWGHDYLPNRETMSIKYTSASACVKAVHDKVSTFEINLRENSLRPPAYTSAGALSDMHPLLDVGKASRVQFCEWFLSNIATTRIHSKNSRPTLSQLSMPSRRMPSPVPFTTFGVVCTPASRSMAATSSTYSSSVSHRAKFSEHAPCPDGVFDKPLPSWMSLGETASSTSGRQLGRFDKLLSPLEPFCIHCESVLDAVERVGYTNPSRRLGSTPAGHQQEGSFHGATGITAHRPGMCHG